MQAARHDKILIFVGKRFHLHDDEAFSPRC